MGRYCAECEEFLDGDEYSSNQWRKGDGNSRCRDCVNGYTHNEPSINGRNCAQCHNFLDGDNFSNNQWNKGDGYSRCTDCVDGYNSYGYECDQCNRTFNTSNELAMHRQVHRPRNVRCPVCGEQRFTSGANAVMHVESGYCRGCPGRDNARQQIFEFASRQRQMNQYMTNTPMLENGSSNGYGQVSDFPYQCRECQKSFRQLGQLMQHQDNKHGNLRMLGY